MLVNSCDDLENVDHLLGPLRSNCHQVGEPCGGPHQRFNSPRLVNLLQRVLDQRIQILGCKLNRVTYLA